MPVLYQDTIAEPTSWPPTASSQFALVSHPSSISWVCCLGCQTFQSSLASLAATFSRHQLSSRGVAPHTLLSHRLPLSELWLVARSVGDVLLVKPVVVYNARIMLCLHFLYRVLKLFFQPQIVNRLLLTRSSQWFAVFSVRSAGLLAFSEGPASQCFA